jgi:hypothetical protein
MKKGSWVLQAAILLAATACGQSPPARAADAPSTVVRVTHRPPLSKDVIEAVLASASVPLTVSPTCHNVGTEPSDATIGRYLAGFMAEMSEANVSNSVQTSVEPGESESDGAIWICRLTLRHSDADDVWGWGVQFHVRQKDGQVLPDSFVCTGAG